MRTMVFAMCYKGHCHVNEGHLLGNEGTLGICQTPCWEEKAEATRKGIIYVSMKFNQKVSVLANRPKERGWGNTVGVLSSSDGWLFLVKESSPISYQWTVWLWWVLCG